MSIVFSSLSKKNTEESHCVISLGLLTKINFQTYFGDYVDSAAYYDKYSIPLFGYGVNV